MSSRRLAEAHEWTVDLAKQYPHEKGFLHRPFIFITITKSPYLLYHATSVALFLLPSFIHILKFQQLQLPRNLVNSLSSKFLSFKKKKVTAMKLGLKFRKKNKEEECLGRKSSYKEMMKHPFVRH